MNTVKQALAHPLAEPANPRASAPTMQEATVMTFASEDLFRGIRMMSRAELDRWLRSETDPVRLRILHALVGVRQAMRV